MSPKIVDLEAYDIRFPTSRTLDGSDAMNPDPDYSAAYVVLKTDARRRRRGARHDVHDRPRQRAVRGRDRGAAPAGRGQDAGVVHRRHGRLLADDSPATASCAGSGPRRASSTWPPPRSSTPSGTCGPSATGKPLWRLLCRHDARGARPLHRLPLHHRRAHARRGAGHPARAAPTRAARDRRDASATATRPTPPPPAGWATPTTSSRGLCREADRRAAGTHFKIKVGRDLEDDVRRARIIREEIGRDRRLMIDANQVWDVDEAIAWMQRLAEFKPVLDRGADQPRRRARPRARSRARSRRSRWRPARCARTG